MKRSINYTGRKRITREHFSIELNRDKETIRAFTASINLKGLDLPENAAVYVEAYHLSDYRRYRFGTVNNPEAKEDTDLANLGYQENLRFRIIVVDESGTHGRILASVDGVKPIGIDDKGTNQKSILPVEFSDIGRQAWSIRYDSDEPILLINDNLRNAAKSDPHFFVYVYPAAFREVLTHMVFVDGIEDVDDPVSEWHKNWLTFARQVSPDTSLPDSLNPGDNGFSESQALEWVDRVVEEFCNSHTNEWNKFSEMEESG